MRFPGPNDVVKLAERSYEAAERAISLVPRLIVIVAEVEQILVAVRAMIAQIETTQLLAADAVVRTEAVVTRAERVVGRTEKLTSTLVPLAEKFEPTLAKLEPMAAHLADTTSPAEVEAVVKLIDMLPDVAAKMQSDIIPVLDTLGTVAPDLRDLLDIAKQVNEMLGAVPGLGRVKKKIDERQDQDDNYTADETPPSAPDRQNLTTDAPSVDRPL